jgi:hypothetical protein
MTSRDIESASRLRVHFWLPPSVMPPSSIDEWDPDSRPDEYTSGAGHNVLEPYVRLKARGRNVTLGSDIPADAHRVVVYLGSIFPRAEQLRSVRALWRRSRVPLVVIRSDFPVYYRYPIWPAVEVMPNQTSVTFPEQIWIAPLPQRGLVPRTEARRGRIRSVGLKANNDNVPALFNTDAWTAGLAKLGLEWRPDVGTVHNQGTPSWHDFSDLDVVLCVRSDEASGGWLRKPATKLLNAWNAGCVPIINREPGYLELAHPNEDAMLVDANEDILDTLASLVADEDLVQRIEQGATRQAEIFSPTAILDQWDAMLFDPAVKLVRTRTPKSFFRFAQISRTPDPEPR